MIRQDPASNDYALISCISVLSRLIAFNRYSWPLRSVNALTDRMIFFLRIDPAFSDRESQTSASPTARMMLISFRRGEIPE
jgi:hypothetical protein